MKAVILAAGKGRRMEHLTLDRPKPLIKIKGKTLLEYKLDSIKDFVDEVIIIIGYKGEMIKKYIGNNYKGMKIKYIQQKEQLGTGHAVKLARKFIDSRFLVILGDDLYAKEDIEECLKCNMSILVSKVNDPSKYGVVLTESDNVKNIIEKPKEFISDLVSTGVYVLHKDIFKEKVEKSYRGEYEIVDMIANLAKKGREIKCVTIKKYWIVLSCPEDVIKAEEFLNTKSL